MGIKGRYSALLLGFLVAFSALVAARSATRVLADDEKDPVDIYILVDESASLSSDDVNREKDALLKLISLNEVQNGESSPVDVQIGILPFSSGSNAPRKVAECALIDVNEGKDKLETCIEGISRQQKLGLTDTDFASAIEGALGLFSRPSATKVIILMTDGIFDPDGDKQISPEEKGRLDRALAKAKESKVSLWPLGFGDADSAALTDYASKAYQGNESCSATPSADLVNSTDLATKIQTIIASATCSDEYVCNLQDCNIEINPFYESVSIEIRDPFGRDIPTDQIAVTKPDGAPACRTATSESGIWRCQESVSSTDGGTWRAAATSTVSGLTARVTTSGRIKLAVINCEVGSNLQLKVERFDESPIQIEPDERNAIDVWPAVLVEAVDGPGKAVGATTDEAIDIKIEGKIPLGAQIRPLLVRDEDVLSSNFDGKQLVIRVAETEICTYVESGAGNSTTSSITRTTNATFDTVTESDDPEPPGPKFPWVPVLVVLLLAAGAIGFVVYRRTKRFPEGTELQVQNGFNAQVFDSVDDVGGKTKIYFDVFPGPNGQTANVSIVDKQSGGRYVISRNDSEQIQVSSNYESDQVSDDADSEESILVEAVKLEPGVPIIVLNDEVFNVRECDPDHAPDKGNPIFLRLNWPVEEDEQDEI